ncbi:hypothetical protein ATANTOWER_031926 [Ataeniobius toweri]|uniref:Uncharacterized protein n=1 Tax=Ataeniobius toweri TaxID=208326 RepID=A0ABU7BM16_9TELE|nr:hypothetical protein [Ataeniobius toweri]
MCHSWASKSTWRRVAWFRPRRPLSWDAFGLDNYEGSSICSQGGRHTPVGQSIQAGQAVSLHHLPAAARQTDFSHSCCALGFAPSVSFAEMAQQLSPGRQVAQASQTHGDVDLPLCPSSMARRDLCAQGRPYGVRGVSQGGGHNRCQPHGLGRCVATESGPGSLASVGALRTHKSAGAAGCTHGPQALPAPPRGTACACSNRQHLCRLPHQPSGRHQIGAPSGGVQGSSGVGLSSSVVRLNVYTLMFIIITHKYFLSILKGHMQM